MYNYKDLETFIDLVHKMAAIEAQKVYDNNLRELQRRILAQLKSGDVMHTGMGICSIRNKHNQPVGENMADVLTQLEYWDKCKAGFNTEDLTKH